ncbi:hypothetical protein NITHO_6200003 [Nitrolancea hollandica Lb]|uniref:Uncharacterized protein n=1 Tax=Nitrolancea hollandica Lb TaxID=1129897 RepID=I4EMM9_9BACT|nr:hypothetical protein NITHO_6200003 [Nitrolancea hollandica Lb]
MAAQRVMEKNARTNASELPENWVGMCWRAWCILPTLPARDGVGDSKGSREQPRKSQPEQPRFGLTAVYGAAILLGALDRESTQAR